MNQKYRILVSDITDPFLNLAVENWLFREGDPDCHLLFLWRNSPSIVMGRFQNPWLECNLDALNKDDVTLVRRQSGGGAVYHDLGNTNFTIMTKKQTFDKNTNNQMICEALKSMGINAYASGRSDLVLDWNDGVRKFSGSAFKQTKDRSFHHGTLLLEADLEALYRYLRPKEKKLVSKSVKSNHSKVINLCEINPDLNHELIIDLLSKAFQNFHQQEAEIEYISNENLSTHESLLPYREEIAAWKWVYGETPLFSMELENSFEWGSAAFNLKSHKGLVKDFSLYSDALHQDISQNLADALILKPYHPAAIFDLLEHFANDFPMFQTPLIEIKNWLDDSLSN